MKISFSPPDIGEEEIAAVSQALRSGWITTGPRTKEFERQIAAYCGVEKAVCLNSATAGLELVLRLLGVGEGDEVITSAYTYSASASVACHVGAKPVLVDTEPGGIEIDREKLAAAITGRTKVIIPVDIGGVVCDYDSIFDIVEQKRGLFSPNNDIQRSFGRIIVLADAAHSLGASRGGKVSGSIADFSCFSFHAVKNLTTAEGGAVTWNTACGMDSEHIYRELMLLALHGQSKDALSKNKPGEWEYDIVYLGYKCNMTDIMAAIGLVQLERYGGMLARRRQLIERYDSAFKESGITSLRHYGKDFSSSGHLYISRVAGADERRRNDIISRLAQAGIASNVHYKPLPMFTAYKNLGYDIADFPNAYDYYRNEITLPLHTLLTDEQQEYIIKNYLDMI